MKKIIILFCCLFCLLNVSAQKTAILLTQFGTSQDEGRKTSLDVLVQEAQKAHPDCEVREAYASPRIRKALEKKGIHKDSAEDALLRLKLDGYTRVLVQPTFLMDGVEMGLLRDDVNRASAFFQEIKIGNPLLYTLEDFKQVVEILMERQPQKDEVIMYVGHGNEYASNAVYSMLNNMLHEAGMKQVYMGTVEGWPDLETSVNQLKGVKAKSVTLIPFLLACGVHAHEDIDGEWKPAIEKAGFKSEVYFHGLGENPKIQQLLLKHLSE